MTAKPSDLFLDLPHQRSHIVDWSGPIDTPTILLLHGLSSNVKMWNLVAPRLAQNFQVVALDQRSHGLTPAPTDNDFGFAAVCDDLHQVCTQLEIVRPIVVGHSWGGNVALEYAVRYADGIAGVVMIDGGYLSLREVMTWSQVEKMTAPPRWAGKLLDEFLSHAKHIWGGQLSTEVLDEIRGNFTVLADQTIVPHLAFDNHLRIMRATWEQSTDALYAQLKCPTLFLPCLPPEPHDLPAQQFLGWKRKTAAHIQKVTSRAQIDWLVDSIHDVPVQRPELVADKILSFVKAVVFTN